MVGKTSYGFKSLIMDNKTIDEKTKSSVEKERKTLRNLSIEFYIYSMISLVLYLFDFEEFSIVNPIFSTNLGVLAFLITFSVSIYCSILWKKETKKLTEYKD